MQLDRDQRHNAQQTRDYRVCRAAQQTWRVGNPCKRTGRKFFGKITRHDKNRFRGSGSVVLYNKSAATPRNGGVNICFINCSTCDCALIQICFIIVKTAPVVSHREKSLSIVLVTIGLLRSFFFRRHNLCFHLQRWFLRIASQLMRM